MIDDIQKWTLCLCACSVLVSAAEMLLPQGSVKKSVYVILSLITASCLLQPIDNIKKITAENFAVSDSTPVNTDWFGRAETSVFESRIEALVNDELKKHGAESKNISVDMSISDDGSVIINKVRIIVSSRYSDKLDELETAVMNDLGFDADIAVR